MSTTNPLHFEPSARLQRFLGQELIADPNLAIGEFVKNGYDAGASQVWVEFLVSGRRAENQEIFIADDGSGMDLEAFRKNWMRPGFSAKAAGASQEDRRIAGLGEPVPGGRVPIGEKGIGRLAAGRLGDELHVYTRTSSSEQWLHVAFRWADFEKMAVPLADVVVPHDFETEPPLERVDAGTVVHIRGLSLNWAGRVPGRKTAGRPDSRLGRLRQDLEFLVLPVQPSAGDFRVFLTSDLAEHQQFVGPVDAGDMRLLDYRFDFSLQPAADGVVVRWRTQRTRSLAEELGTEVVSEDDILVPWGEEGTDEPTSHAGSLECGAFEGSFFYAPQSGTARRFRDLRIAPGVLLYRNGIRAQPYGDPDDDWLGARARKAARQGYAAIQPNQLYGYVSISKQMNPELIDMTNRQGLVENDAYDDFVAHARAEFRRFEDIVFKEYVQPAWEGDTSRAQKVAERTQDLGTALIRDVVHSLRQPIAALGTEMGNVDWVVANDEMPPATRASLSSITQRAHGHLEEVERVVAQFLERGLDAEIEPVQLDEIVKAAAAQVRPAAATYGAEIIVTVEERVVVAPRIALQQAVTELLRNAVAAPRAPGIEGGKVFVRSTMTDGQIVLSVEDDGEGVSEDIGSRLFREPVSTKGRQGAGLQTVRDLLATFRASIRLANPGEPGARFEISMPSMGDVRKELRS